MSGVSYVPVTQPIEVVGVGLDAYLLNNFEDAEPTYIGKVKSDGAWLIQKYTSAGVMLYANSSNNLAITSYPDAWDARATLFYDQFQLLTAV